MITAALFNGSCHLAAAECCWKRVCVSETKTTTKNDFKMLLNAATAAEPCLKYLTWNEMNKWSRFQIIIKHVSMLIY